MKRSQSHLSPLKARARGDKKRRPIFAVVRMVRVADRLYTVTAALTAIPAVTHSCHNVPSAPLAVVEQQWSRHGRLSPLNARAHGDKKRHPIFAVVRI